MSGHSKWSTIKRQKGAADIKRGLTFTKIANSITLAAKLGNSGDPNSNPRLKMAMEEARGANMPKANVQRAIDRGLGKLPGQTIEEVLFEGFGPGKVAFIIEGVTDNRMRILQEVKNLFERSGGSLTSPGGTAYLFDKVGEIRIASKGISKDEEILELIDLGAEEVEDYEQENGQIKYLIYTKVPELNTMSNKITQSGFPVESAQIIFKPNLLVTINDQELAKRLLEFNNRLEENDDIQGVYGNFVLDTKLISN